MIGIYKITSPSNSIYIGQSINIEKRRNQYRLLKCDTQPKLYNSLKKYGFDNHIFELVTECYVSELNNLERYYQELYNTIGEKGLNCLLASSDTEKVRFSEQTRKKMSLSQTGKKQSLETLEKKRKYMIGKKMPREGVLKSVEARRGFKHSEETKKILSAKTKAIGHIISASKLGKKMPPEVGLKISLRLKGKPSKLKGIKRSDEFRRRVYESYPNKQIILHIEYGIFYETTKEAWKSTNFPQSSFGKMMNGMVANKTLMKNVS